MSEGTGEEVVHDLRYDVDEKPPFPLASLLAAQTVLLIVAGIVLRGAATIRSPAGSK